MFFVLKKKKGTENIIDVLFITCQVSGFLYIYSSSETLQAEDMSGKKRKKLNAFPFALSFAILRFSH